MEKKLTKREIKTQQTRETIINAALDLFRRYGFERTSIQDICAEAKVSVGSLYHLFESKRAIIEYVLKDIQHFYDPEQEYDYQTVNPEEIFRQGASNFKTLIETLTPEVVFNALFSSPSGNKTMFYKERSNVAWMRKQLRGLRDAGRIPAEMDINHLEFMLNGQGLGLFYAAYTMDRMDTLEDDMYTALYGTFLQYTNKKRKESVN